ncbi:MAG: fatty acyl-AMP ligase [Pelolinea sp.]|jgi:acyl-CoA synthetase (AMP-forming)/AMP-acid ligase II|nr:fatty acyl-AMP ligase [Pelolinea sp.]
MKNFSSVLLEHYANQGDKVILYFQSIGKEDLPITYKSLLENSYCYTKEYIKNGIKPGDIIILVLQHSLELIYAYYGAILAGAIPSIMPFLTEKLLPEKYQQDFQSLVKIIQPESIITYQEFKQGVFDQFSQQLPVHSMLLCEEIALEGEPLPAGLPGLTRDSQDIVLLQHSSGTTGLQKGVALTHQAVFQQLEHYSKAIHLAPQKDVIVSWLPLYHDMGLIACFLMPILCGVPLVMMSPFDWVKAPYRLFTSISNYHGTLCWLPNFAYNFCAKKIRDSQLEEVDLSSLRAVINCSEPVRYESHQAFLQKYRPFGFKASALAASYAMAENVFAVTQGGVDFPLVEDHIDRDDFQMHKKATPVTPGAAGVIMLSTGRPIESVAVQVIDEQGKLLGERQIGEVIIQSDCLFTGYYNRPDITEKSVLNGWFKTGDYGYLAEGEVYITGRKKDLIIVGGKNIYPQDLEAIAMEVEGVHPGRVVAFGIFNESSGTEDVVIVAEANKGAEDKEEIGNAIKEKVTRNSAIALRHVLVVDEKWLIKTSSGKIARSANKEKYLAQLHLPN